MDSLEQTLDELYSAQPEEFVALRSRLAKALKQNGRADDAKSIMAIRKPTVAAWALNQLSRNNRRETDLLLNAGERLRQAQAGVLAGTERHAFNEARRAERKAVTQLTRKAEILLEARGKVSATVLNQISQSLSIGAISPQGRDLLARGRFSEPLQAEGFGLVSDLAGANPPPVRRPSKPSAKEQERRQLSQALREAKAELRAAERAAADAKANAERLAAEATRAGAKSDEAGASARAAASRVEAAEKQLRSANRGH